MRRTDRFQSVRRPQISCPSCKKYQEVEIRSGFIQKSIEVTCKFCTKKYSLRETQDCFTGETFLMKNEKVFFDD